jgi:hypothetical protein
MIGMKFKPVNQDIFIVAKKKKHLVSAQVMKKTDVNFQ